MNQHSQQPIEDYLRLSDVQARIWARIQETRENIMVTISRAASLSGFSENKLREWERKGLLQTERLLLSQDGKGSTGHRQYSSMELDKLAIIRELVDQGYAPGDIPPDIDRLWNEIVGRGVVTLEGGSPRVESARTHQENRRPIDKRVEDTDRQEFWRYFVSQALRISLRLICEDIPDTLAGIILPLENHQFTNVVHSPEDLPRVGLSLVGWLGRNRSFYSFMDEAPAFEFPSDFRLEKLPLVPGRVAADDDIADNIFIVLQRRARVLSLAPELVEAVLRVLSLVYKRMADWRPSFDYGMHDWLYQAHDLERSSNVAGDLIFNALLERIVELGGKDRAGNDRWHFCTMMLPNDPSLPIQEQSLVLRAQTRNSPYEIGVMTLPPNQSDSLGLKAFQSGQMIYFPHIYFWKSATAYHSPGVDIATLESSTRSALALPIPGEFGISVGALYIASHEAQAFSLSDERVLRIINRMVEELLLTSQGRRQVMGKLGSFVWEPAVVDPTFRGFRSEASFSAEIETLLATIRGEELIEEQAKDILTVVSVDIDNQSGIALKYGNRVARNVSQQVGQRLQGQMRLSNRFSPSNVFHVSADKYYLLMRGVTLEDAQKQARLLKEILQESIYRISRPPSYTSSGQVLARENMLDLPGIKFHLGISWWTFEKLGELLQRYSTDSAVVRVRTLIMEGIEEVLGRGRSGDCIFTWDPEIWGYRRLD